MTVLYCVILTICYFTMAFVARHDVFSPRFIFNAYAWLKNVPYFAEVGATYEEDLQFRYFLLKLGAWFMVNLGITVYESYLSKKYVYVYSDLSERRGGMETSYIIGVFLMLAGTAMRVYILMRAGGIAYVLTHLQIRRSMLSGLSYFSTISNILLTCGVLVLEYYMCKKPVFRSRITFLVALVLAALLLLVFGARKPVLMLMLKVFMCYHYCKRRIRLRDLVKPRFLVLVVLVMFFMVMVPMLRYRQNTGLLLSPGEWLRAGAEALDSVFQEFSYLSGDMFVFDHFRENSKWFGQSYLNIFVQWIPSSIYHNKPPMDDGMYLYNMMRGFYVTPHTPTVELPYQTSIPFTMEGALYSNFGAIGALVGSFFIGVLYQYVYKITRDCGFSFYMLQVYQVVIFEYVPSVLHTTSPIINMLFVTLILVPLFRIRIRRVPRRHYQAQLAARQTE